MFYNPNKKKKPVLGSEVLQKMFEGGNSILSQQFIRWKLWGKWGEFVGPTMAKQCEPVGYYKGTLYIWVKHPTLIQQLTFLKDQMRNQINHRLNMKYVTEIRFTLDRRSVPANSTQELKQVIEKIAPQIDED